MNSETVSVVRIYIREQEHLLHKLVKFLKDDCAVAGLTVIRGVEGFSANDAPKSAFLVDLSLDLPLVVEFFESPENVERIIPLLDRFDLHHVVTWQAQSFKKSSS